MTDLTIQSVTKPEEFPHEKMNLSKMWTIHWMVIHGSGFHKASKIPRDDRRNVYNFDESENRGRGSKRNLSYFLRNRGVSKAWIRSNLTNPQMHGYNQPSRFPNLTSTRFFFIYLSIFFLMNQLHLILSSRKIKDTVIFLMVDLIFIFEKVVESIIHNFFKRNQCKNHPEPWIMMELPKISTNLQNDWAVECLIDTIDSTTINFSWQIFHRKDQ